MNINCLSLGDIVWLLVIVAAFCLGLGMFINEWFHCRETRKEKIRDDEKDDYIGI